jgi:hypothetical protein
MVKRFDREKVVCSLFAREVRMTEAGGLVGELLFGVSD